MGKCAREKSVYLIVITIWLGLKINAQDNLYLFSRISQASLSNPAIQNESDNLVIGFPFLSGVSLNLNADFAFNSLFADDISSYSFEKFYNSLKPFGKGRISTSYTSFFISLKRKKWNYSLSLSGKINLTTTFNREIVSFIRDGTLSSYGTNKNFGNASLNFVAYRELTLGVSKKISNKMQIGIRPKILFGKLFFNTESLNLSVETKVPDNELFVKPEGKYVFCAPFKKYNNPETSFTNFSANIVPGDYFLNFKNLGFAADAGIVFKAGERSEIAASILDLGFIGFKHNTFVTAFSKPIVYKKNELYQSLNQEESRYMEPKEALIAFSDSLSYIIDANETSLRTFTFIPVSLNFSSKYNFYKNAWIGIYDRFSLQGKYSANNLITFLTGHFFKNRLEISGSMNIYNVTSVRPGFGINFTSNKFQFYAFSHNITSVFNPVAAKHLNLCFGINLLFATK